MEGAGLADHIVGVDVEEQTKNSDDSHHTEKPNLEDMNQEELLQNLRVNREEGLSSEEAAQRLQIYGPNVLEMPEEEDTKERRWMNKLCFCLKWDSVIPEHKNMMILMLNSISSAMIFAAIVTASLYSIGGYKVYLYDALAITFLLLLNYTICFAAMRLVENEKTPLNGSLKPKTKVLRDGRWREEDPANLVPGDIIFLRWGDIVPADVRLLADYGVATKLGMWCRGVSKGSVVYCQKSLLFGEGVAIVTATGRDISARFKKLRPNQFGRPGQLRTGIAVVGNLCSMMIIIGTLIELFMTSATKLGGRSMLHGHLILLIGGIPMAMPVVFYLCLACGSHKLSRLGVASRGTVGLEDLAAVDTIFFNVTGTLTLNEPKFDRNKIQVFARDMDEDDAILVAARSTNLGECDLYQEPIDAAILNMLANPDEANSGIKEGAKYSPFKFFQRTSSCTYRLQDGRYYRAIKGDPESIMKCYDCSTETMDEIKEKIELLARDGYHSLAIARQDFAGEPEYFGPAWNLVALMPYKDDLREDCAETIGSLVEMGLRVIVLTGGQTPITKEICRRLGIPETNVQPFRNSDLIDGILSKACAIAITNAHNTEIKEDIVNYAIDEMGYRCAFVGGGMYDIGALEKSHVAISSPDASDKARSLSDLVLSTTSLAPLFKSAQLSRASSEMMANYLIYAVSSTVHVLAILLISLIWKVSFSCFLVLVTALFNYGIGFAFLWENKSTVRSRSPLIWKVWNMVGPGASFGCYLFMTTVIFIWSLNFIPGVFNVRPLDQNDDGIRAALFLQVSIANQAVVFFARFSKCRVVDCPGPVIFGAYTVLQMAATSISVYADMDFDGVKGIGWGWAVVIWMYDFLMMLGLGSIKFLTTRYGEKSLNWISSYISQECYIQTC